MILDKLFSLQAKKAKKAKKIKKIIRKNFLISLLILDFLLLLPILFLILYQIVFWERVFPFVREANFDLTGKTEKQLVPFLTQILKDKDLEKVQVFFEDKQWSLSMNRFSLFYSPSQTAQKALKIGKQGDLRQRLAEQKAAFWQRINLGFDFELDQALLAADIASIAAQIDLPAIPPTIEIAETVGKKTVTIKEGQPGKKIDQEKIVQTILENLGQLKSTSLFLQAEETFPPIDKKMVEKTYYRAEKLLDKTIILSFEQDAWKIQEKELINFLSFYGGWDEKKIADYAQGFAKSVNRPPQNALFNFAGGRVLEFKPARDGLELDQEKTVKLIKQNLEELEKNQDKKNLQITLPVALTPPSVSTEQVNTFGVRELLGTGQSWFYGSIAGRIHNIKLAASKLNGVLVAPGETFSLNKTIGDISAATGFQQAYVIQSGRTVLGDGGGVCQVSTTVFRAVLNAGLPVEERRPHAYRVGYYEYNSPPGLDATIFYPSDDFKFKNDTPAHILIQTFVDTSQSLIKVQFYGTHDGRQAIIGPSKVWDQIAPPPDLYQDDPTLPVGTVKQVDWRAWGAKVAFDWQVTRGDQTLQKRTFYSQYKPWQAIFLRGTKQ